LPELSKLSDNLTIILVVIIIGLFLILMVIIASRQIGSAINRLAKAIEDRNSASAEDLEQVRSDISREISGVAGEVDIRLDRHVELTQGEVSRLDDGLNALDTNTGRLAGDIVTIGDVVGIAGSSLWAGGLIGRVDNPNVHIAPAPSPDIYRPTEQTPLNWEVGQPPV